MCGHGVFWNHGPMPAELEGRGVDGLACCVQAPDPGPGPRMCAGGAGNGGKQGKLRLWGWAQRGRGLPLAHPPTLYHSPPTPLPGPGLGGGVLAPANEDGIAHLSINVWAADAAAVAAMLWTLPSVRRLQHHHPDARRLNVFGFPATPTATYAHWTCTQQWTRACANFTPFGGGGGGAGRQQVGPVGEADPGALGPFWHIVGKRLITAWRVVRFRELWIIF
ncbi:hypothetical protein EDC01DRAFT_745381 [Geopyxis carbonaria]|nr:hypothetical protein EDC01DRAFT_745381 [Geopyxis carbonaria]